MSLDVLLLAAFHPELAALRPHLAASGGGAGESGRIGAFDVAARAVGIGLPGAAVGATTHIAASKPRAVILLGTCGGYAGRGIAIGDVVLARRVRLVDPAVVEGRAGFPDPMSLAVDANAALATALAAIAGPAGRYVDVATTLAVTTDDALAARVASASGCDAEHLEAFAVATACAAHGVPFALALGVANVVGARARDEWRANHRAASDAATAVVLAWLGAGASGLAPTP